MKIIIERVNNGYVLTNTYPKDVKCDPDVFIFADSKSDLVSMLYEVVKSFGELGSRYDQERITITLASGDKYECP